MTTSEPAKNTLTTRIRAYLQRLIYSYLQKRCFILGSNNANTTESREAVATVLRSDPSRAKVSSGKTSVSADFDVATWCVDDLWVSSSLGLVDAQTGLQHNIKRELTPLGLHY